MKFLVDFNVGRLGRWLRIAGFDTLLVQGIDDNRIVRLALDENRVLLSKDREIFKRRIVASGKLKALLIKDDDVKVQLGQVLTVLGLTTQMRPFSRCIECNEPIIYISKRDVEDIVPPYVFQTQEEYMQCPACRRIYWRGTHWQRMRDALREIGNQSE